MRIHSFIQARSGQVLEDGHTSITRQLAALELNIGTKVDSIQQSISQNNDRRLQFLTDSDNTDDDMQLGQLTRAVREVDEQSSVLQGHVICANVFRAQVHSVLTGQKIGDVLTEEQSHALVGMPTSVVGKVKYQRIGDGERVHAETGQGKGGRIWPRLFV